MALKQQRNDSAGPLSEGAAPGAVLSWFQKRAAIPLAPPPRLREYAPLSDDPDYPNATFPSRYIAGATFGIEYLDLRGWLSTRTIRCVALDPTRPGLLRAYCNVRKTTRTFRLDRIISTTNLRTGVTSQSGGERVLFAPAFLPDDPACAAFLRLVEATRPGVFVLLSLGMADGWLSVDARDVISGYMTAEAAHRGLPMPPQDLITMWLENLSPPKEAVLDGLTRLLADTDALVRFLPRILEISRTFCSATQDHESLFELIRALRMYFRPRAAARAIDLIAWR